MPLSLALLNSLIIHLKEKPLGLWSSSPGHTLVGSIRWPDRAARSVGPIMRLYGPKQEALS